MLDFTTNKGCGFPMLGDIGNILNCVERRGVFCEWKDAMLMSMSKRMT